MSVASAPAPRRRVPLGLIAAGALGVLAIVETANAIVAPALAPSDDDWSAAARIVRAGFRPGDLVVTAPDWADQVMRLHLGDLVPQAIAGRMDAARFGRVWEIGQRGAHSPDAAGAQSSSTRAGALTVRLVERKPAEVSYDFLARFGEAHVTRRGPAGDAPCAMDAAGSRAQCPDFAWNFAAPALLEIGGTLRRAVYAQPVGGATMIVEYPRATLGRELAFAAGLHHVWLRKQGTGRVVLKIFVDGKQVATQETSNRTGFQLGRADTSAWAGRTAAVRFEISAADAFSRHFGFVAEARTP